MSVVTHRNQRFLCGLCPSVPSSVVSNDPSHLCEPLSSTLSIRLFLGRLLQEHALPLREENLPSVLNQSMCCELLKTLLCCWFHPLQGGLETVHQSGFPIPSKQKMVITLPLLAHWDSVREKVRVAYFKYHLIC